MAQAISDSQAVAQYEGIVAAELCQHRRFKHLEEDMYQEGLIALVKAARTWNPEHGAKFQTFATTVVRSALLDFTKSQRLVKGFVHDKKRPKPVYLDQPGNETVFDSLTEEAVQEEAFFAAERKQILDSSIKTLTPSQKRLIGGHLHGDKTLNKSSVCRSLKRALPALQTQLKASGAFDDR